MNAKERAVEYAKLLDKKNRENREIKAQLDDKTREVSEYIDRNEILKGQIEVMEMERDQGYMMIESEEVKEYEAKIKQLKGENREWEQIAQKHTLEYAELSKELGNEKAKVTNLLNTNTLLREDKGNLLHENVSLRHAQDGYQLARFQKLQLEHEELKDNISSKSNQRMSILIDELKSEVDAKNQTIKDLNKDLKKEVFQMDKDNGEWAELVEEMIRKGCESEEEIRALKKTLETTHDEASKKIRKFRDKITIIEKERDDARARRDQYQRKIHQAVTVLQGYGYV
jgi:chromosome segregation ATPase